jgi:hypothetical protein
LTDRQQGSITIPAHVFRSLIYLTLVSTEVIQHLSILPQTCGQGSLHIDQHFQIKYIASCTRIIWGPVMFVGISCMMVIWQPNLEIDVATWFKSFSIFVGILLSPLRELKYLSTTHCACPAFFIYYQCIMGRITNNFHTTFL